MDRQQITVKHCTTDLSLSPTPHPAGLGPRLLRVLSVLRLLRAARLPAAAAALLLPAAAAVTLVAVLLLLRLRLRIGGVPSAAVLHTLRLLLRVPAAAAAGAGGPVGCTLRRHAGDRGRPGIVLLVSRARRLLQSRT